MTVMTGAKISCWATAIRGVLQGKRGSVKIKELSRKEEAGNAHVNKKRRLEEVSWPNAARSLPAHQAPRAGLHCIRNEPFEPVKQSAGDHRTDVDPLCSGVGRQDVA